MSFDVLPWNHLVAMRRLLLFQSHILEASLAMSWTFGAKWTFEVYQKGVLGLGPFNNM
jgi:hypothetical protein